MKDPTFYASMSSGEGSIINANRARHGPLRKQASHGFSERALKSQEHVIVSYVDLMLSRLEESIALGKSTVDMVDWYNVSELIILSSTPFCGTKVNPYSSSPSM